MWKTLTREMKDSGIEWIGEIPVNWKISKVGSHFTERNEKVSALDYKPLSVTKRGILPQLEEAAKSSNPNNRKLVLPNDFVINSRSDRKMSSGLSDLEGSVSLINTVLYSKTIDKNYTKYLLKNYGFAEEFYKWGSGIVADLWSTRWNEMKNIPIPVPPKETQVKIGMRIDFLNNRIENLINNTLRSIEELKKYKQSLITEAVTKGLNPHVEMKDSGIEWIGKIPEHWSISRIKNEFTLNKGLTITKSDLKDKGIPVINYGEIHSRYGFRFDTKIHPVKNVDEEYLIKNENSLIKKGDFIFADTSEDLEGAGNFTCYIGDAQCFAGSHTVVLKPRKNINHLYYSYLFESLAFRAQIQEKVQGIKVFSITQGILKPLILIIPTEQEQKQIVTYLDEQTSRIDKLIADKTKIIEELENYKKSLIYEYVTGKKEA